ncbi:MULTISPECIES: tRNA pseudouridine(38-40) synthase TruA [Terrabacteria group]|uniref:tRNA pseudouridine(38-40) synthase TruA n=1 Tax=Bacillati TaxID=1783272 RepID=UPI001C6E4FB8|nr:MULTISPECIES: tRNA pseudouridine(38-40) synthase TruA [Terrabacteria group]MBW9212639.1 tRNA pseudouridine(38-40) synthase TruA [Trueperella sp. zg.1013]
MRYFKAIVSYVGANYCGWQSQKKGNSIQEKIEDILEQINQKKTSIIASGRTDAKVNALGQCFQFQSEKDIDAYHWLGIFHSFLPKDIYVKEIEEVDEDFHARFLVEQKTYVYRLHLGEYDVFQKDCALQLDESLDLNVMRACWHLFKGTHSFLSFNTSSLTEYPNQIRTIFHTEFRELTFGLELEISGNGYLRHMVRMLVGTCLEVGRNKLSLDEVCTMLKEPSRKYSTKKVAAQGLCLKNVTYHHALARNEAYLLRDVSSYDRLDEKVAYVLIERKENGCCYALDSSGCLLEGSLPTDANFLEIVEKAKRKGLCIIDKAK